ncbi:UNVERIFIED_CONTAM: Retrovirus-related Pol polyprotein from transposon RE2 [Sesamum radiatum]|uniref:Retrovirus-related Pol polyprotein from transposon RE2 n=1 Tax=Sesamum radiatum TaxID=300843 RepID=A0AAW2M1X6_SESRA
MFHVLGMMKNLLLVAQLTSSGHIVLFGPQDVKVYRNVEILGELVMMGQRMESVYVMSVETAKVYKTRRNETVDLWHMRLSHVSYSKLDTMMKKSMLKGLSKLEVRKDTVCAGSQYGKAHQLPYEESNFRAKEPLELIHSDVFGPVKQASIGGMKYMVLSLMTSREWRKAIEEELAALERNQTLELVPKLNGVKPISCKWVYKIKRRTDGSIEKHKGRLVARGFSQQYGLDYDEMFSPVAKLPSSTCSEQKLELVANGYHSEYVCKLRKALYGLKQAPRAWYGKIAEFLTHSGYLMTSADSSLFIKAKERKLAIVLVYADDLIITGDYEEEVLQTKESLSVRFQMKELGHLKHFLDLEVHDTRRSTTGYVFMLGSGAVSWCSKRQPTVSLSTIEAEYWATAMAAPEITWLVQLLKDLHQPIEYGVPLYCNNLSAIRLAKNSVFHARTKHVEVHYHFIRAKDLKE